MQVAIQGMRGSFHDEALYHIFTDPKTSPDIRACADFRTVFSEVREGIVDAGLVAVENSLYGSINEVYRLFAEHDMWITHEVRMHIEQCLIGIQSMTVDILQSHGANVQVLSQSPALAQVEMWLGDMLPQAIRIEAPDTAGSVQHIMINKDPNMVAIASAAAANEYGATIVARGIQDDPGNYTRFVLFTRNVGHRTPLDATACSLILTTDHQPGSLYRALGAFNDNTVNLHKLDSHPIAGDEQHYNFYIDADQSGETETMQHVLEALHAQGCTVKMLGSYERHI